MLSQLNDRQRHTLLTALSLILQTRATHFDNYELLDALIDLEDNSLIEFDPHLIFIAQHQFVHLEDSQIIEIISQLLTQLKQEAIAA